MVYAKQTPPEIEKLVEGISSLEPGEELRIGPMKNPFTLRWKIYSWMHNTGVKELFKIRTKAKFLLVERKEEDIDFVKVGSTSLPEKLSTILAELIKNPEEAEILLADYYKEGNLTAIEFAEVLNAFHETQK